MEKTIGVLTSGGDAPGRKAAERSMTRKPVLGIHINIDILSE